MIIEKQYEIKINAANHNHFSKWYNNLKCGQIIYCEVSQLLKSSRTRIDVRCDLCGVEKKLEYRDYTRYDWVNGEYFCKKCKIEKKHGVKNVFQLDEVKEKIKATLLERYEVDNISKLELTKEKKKKTSQKNFSVDYPQQSEIVKRKSLDTLKSKWNVGNISSLDEIKLKKRKTYKDKTGFDFVFNNPEFISSQIELNLKKYGVTHSFSADEIKAKIAATNFLKWGNEIASKSELIKKKIKKNVTNTLHKKTFDTITELISIDSEKRLFKIKCDKCEDAFEITWALFYKRRETKTIICTSCNPVDKHQSGLELDFYNFIKSIYNDEIKQNFKIDSKELDIYLPNQKLAFEFNGLYWHSELFKERDYHLIKTNICRANDITLIHIWEDDWLYNRMIIESMIKNKLGITEEKIYARNCDIKTITEKEIVNDFLDSNHIQGKVVFSKALGLFYNNELVSLITFVKRKSSWELNRFCNKLNCSVVGGASKLLKHFTEHHSSNIFTFSDNSYSSGNLYRVLGFVEEYNLRPDYRIVEFGIRRHKFNYRKTSNKNLLKIWDAGKIKFKKR